MVAVIDLLPSIRVNVTPGNSFFETMTKPQLKPAILMPSGRLPEHMLIILRLIHPIRIR
jgi:hypothetical protein